MKQLKILLAQLLIVASLLLPWSPAGAVENFKQFGIIKSVGQTSFTVRKQVYRIAPGAKLRSDDPARQRLSDFSKGDKVYFEGKIVGDDYLVDLVVYEIPIPE